MSAYDAICEQCDQPIWGVNKSADEILWYHKPVGRGRKHCAGSDTVAEPRNDTVTVVGGNQP